MRDDSRCSTHSSLRMSDGIAACAAGRSTSTGVAPATTGSSGSRCSVILWTSRTSKTSEAISRKIPLMPVCDAIASMREAIRSKVGPDVSERAKRSCSL